MREVFRTTSSFGSRAGSTTRFDSSSKEDFRSFSNFGTRTRINDDSPEVFRSNTNLGITRNRVNDDISDEVILRTSQFGTNRFRGTPLNQIRNVPPANPIRPRPPPNPFRPLPPPNLNRISSPAVRNPPVSTFRNPQNHFRVIVDNSRESPEVNSREVIRTTTFNRGNNRFVVISSDEDDIDDIDDSREVITTFRTGNFNRNRNNFNRNVNTFRNPNTFNRNPFTRNQNTNFNRVNNFNRNTNFNRNRNNNVFTGVRNNIDSDSVEDLFEDLFDDDLDDRLRAQNALNNLGFNTNRNTG